MHNIIFSYIFPAKAFIVLWVTLQLQCTCRLLRCTWLHVHTDVRLFPLQWVRCKLNTNGDIKWTANKWHIYQLVADFSLLQSHVKDNADWACQKTTELLSWITSTVTGKNKPKRVLIVHSQPNKQISDKKFNISFL